MNNNFENQKFYSLDKHIIFWHVSSLIIFQHQRMELYQLMTKQSIIRFEVKSFKISLTETTVCSVGKAHR